MPRVRPFLMFQGGQAEAAMRFYTALFDDGAILEIERYGAGQQGPEGSVKLATFRVGGQEVMCIDSPVAHAFSFTPATSLFVNFDDDAQLQRAHDALLQGGAALMPLGHYGFSRRFAWLNDRHGVSWQLNLP